MIASITRALVEDTDKLIRLLEYYDFCKIKKREKYIQFARDQQGSSKSITVFLKDNEDCFVVDFARGYKGNIISFIQTERGLEFSEVIKVARDCAEVAGYIPPRRKVFGGMLERKTYDEFSVAPEINDDCLNGYTKIANKRFFKDGISAQTQMYFGIRYDEESHNIVLPIYRSDGVLMGVKARRNFDTEENEFKYFYIHSCMISLTLYGYSHNYKYLMESKTVIVVEAEKSVMQAYEMGYRNFVALGSSSLSKKQAQLILRLHPKKVMFMMDEGLSTSIIERNCRTLSQLIVLREIKICYWQPGSDVPPKSSPTDCGKQRFVQAVRKEMCVWKDA